MKYTLTSRKLSIDDQTRNFIDEKLSKIEKYSNKLTNIHVIINKEKFNFPIEILINGKYFNIKGMGLANDIKASFEIALSKVLKQLVKRKDKIKQHKNSDKTIKNQPEMSITEEGTESNNIVEKKEIDIIAMDINEALSNIQKELLNFFVFIDKIDKKISILYKNLDDSYCLMKIR